jgi:SPP1 gp7 family putative phage head morphogenesis protein
MLDDPTFSAALQVEYANTIKRIVSEFRADIIKELSPVEERELGTYAKDKSYSPAKLLAGIKNKVSQRSISQITNLVKYQVQHGTQLAMRQLKVSPLPRFLGKYVNMGTVIELSHVSVNLVKSIQQRYLDSLKLLVARVIGAGTLSWSALVQGIKKLGKISNVQAEQIARTEVVRAVTAGQAEEFKRRGIDTWMWITQLDERVCPVCSSIHGKCVQIGDPFIVTKKGPIFKPPAHPNCRCGVDTCV